VLDNRLVPEVASHLQTLSTLSNGVTWTWCSLVELISIAI